MSNENSKDKKVANVPNLRFCYSGNYQSSSLGSLIFQKGKRAKGAEKFWDPYSINNDIGFSLQKEQWGEASYTKLEKNGYKTIFANDIAYNPARINVGSIGIYKNKKPGIVSSLYVCFHTKETLCPDYLYKYMKSDRFNKKVKKTEEGGVRSYFFFDKLEKTKMFLPPTIKEQEEVVSFLALIDKRIEAQNKIISAYKSLMKPLFECMNDGGGKEFCIDEIGTYYPCDSLSWDEMSSKGNPAIIYGQLFTDYSLIIQDIVGHTKKQISSKSKGNDLLFPSSTTVDSLSLISPSSLSIADISLGGDMFFIALNEGFNCDYLSLLINFEYRKQLARFAQGSTIIHLHYESIKNFKLIIAPKEIQKKIASCEKQIIKIIDVENKLLNCLKEQKQYFLKNLFI